MFELDAHILSTLQILFIMCAAGAFGGMLDVIQLIDVRKLVEQEGPIVVFTRRFFVALALGAFGGIGGAVAMLFIITATAKLDTGDKPENLLLLISLGMVSGFLGYRVLRSVAMRVEKQIQDVEERTDKKIREAESNLKRYTEIIEAVNIGRSVVADRSAERFALEEAIEKLEALRSQMPDHREINIVLGTIYRKMGKYRKAIQTLTEALQAMRAKGAKDKDVADVLYNRACYYNLLADSVDGTERGELKQNAFADLEASFRLSPSNRSDAAEDGDFLSLRNEERFRTLTTSSLISS